MNLGIYKPLVILGSITLLILLLCIPVGVSVKNTSTEIMGSRAMIENQYHQRQELREVISSLESIRARTSSLSKYAIHEGGELAFVQALENIATRYNVDQEINLVTANQKIISAWENEVPIDIKLFGDYIDILGYLRQVEALPYYVKINTLSLSRSQRRDRGSTEERLQATISGQVSWLSSDAPSFVINDHSL